MTIAIWCVLFAAALPIVCTGMAKAGSTDFDNARPREWQANLEGWRRRATAAQNNSFEAFPMFAVAVLVATTQGAAGVAVDILALAWVAFRLAYVWAYVSDHATLRSTFFALAFFSAVAIFIAPVWR